MKDRKLRLSAVTIALHWIVALSVIMLLAVGFYMETTKAFALYGLHKSFGALIFFIVVARVLWRIANGFPEALSQVQRLELLLSKVVHWVLLIGSMLMPMSGMLMSAAGGRGVYMFGVELIASNPDPINPGKVVALSKEWASVGSQMHEVVAWVMVVAIVLHIAGALKHHFVYKDQTLLRMKGKQISE
ncbi:MAG: cytochrome b [Gammaproteobacteria bacterium]|nr:cytochrome b [Gammaproteobacteria bacterium]